MSRVVVVGAGYAGLAAADTLRRAGVEVVVLEAHGRVGGRVWSDTLPSGAVIERGGEFVTKGYDTMERYASDLGLELRGMGIRYPERRLVPDPGLARADVVSAAERAERAARAAPHRPALDILREAVADDDVRELLAARVQSSRAYPVEELDARFLLDVTTLVDDAETRRIDGGNQLLAERLADRLEHLHLDERVHRVSATGAGVVVVGTGRGETEAAACLVAIPVPGVNALELSPPAPAAYAKVRMSTAAKLAVSLEGPEAPAAVMSAADRWWAYTTTSDGIGGCTLGAWAGAAPVVELVGARTGPAGWLAAVDALWPGLSLQPGSATVTLWDDRAWPGGAYSVLPHAREASPGPLDGAGAIVFAGEHTAGDWAATMEGALRSGERAAGTILARLGQR